MMRTAILDELERDLHARLRVDLPRVAAGEDSLYFYNSDYNPFDLPESKLSTRGSEAYRLACQIRDLRERLGEPMTGVALLLLDAIEHHADQSDQHRLGGKRLAVKLSENITKMAG